MIIGSTANPIEIIGTLKLVKHAINLGDWIFILDFDFVKLTVVDTYFERTIFLFHKVEWSTPQGLLDQMKPLCKRSYHYSLKLDGAIIKGEIDLGCVYAKKIYYKVNLSVKRDSKQILRLHLWKFTNYRN